MDKKKCEEILLYMDDMLDDRADEAEAAAFNEHLETCEKCRTKYGILRNIREIVSRAVPQPEASMAAEITARLDAEPQAVVVKERKPLTFGKVLAIVLIAVLFLVSVVTGVYFAVRYYGSSATEGVIHLDENGEIEKYVPDDENGLLLVRRVFLPEFGLPSSLIRGETLAGDDILDALDKKGYGAGTDFGGIVFAVCSDLDELNVSGDVAFVPGSGTENGALFVWERGYLLFSDSFPSLYEEYFLLADGPRDRLLIVAYER